jgi:hypothetical protein
MTKTVQFYMFFICSTPWNLISHWPAVGSCAYDDTKFFTSTFVHPFQQFRKLMLNFQLHNRRYHKHFYQRWLGHGHCLKICDLFSTMDTETRSIVARDIKLIMWDTAHSSVYYRPSTFVLPTVHPHECSLYCVNSNSLQIDVKNIFSVTTKDHSVWKYYTNLTDFSKSRFRLTHVLHKDLNQKCVNILLKELSLIYSDFTIEFTIQKRITITIQKRMILDDLLPLGLKNYLESD